MNEAIRNWAATFPLIKTASGGLTTIVRLSSLIPYAGTAFIGILKRI
ncbi:MAG: hypothetical protein IJ980_06105 [Oscillospiraceae bacterium]|nr:hypothetical protein [Oscillospiraceae bacterium]